MTLSGILSRSAAKIQNACICLFKNNCADYIQCNSSLLQVPPHRTAGLLAAAAQSESEIQFSGVAHFYVPTGYCFPHMTLEGFLGWHFYQGYRKLVPASDCVREERELVCLHVVLNNVGLLVLDSGGSWGLTDIVRTTVRYIDRYVVIFDLVELGESGNTVSLLMKCWPIQSLSHLCHLSLSLIVTRDIPHRLPLYPLYLVYMVLFVWIPYCVSILNTLSDE